MKKFSQSLIILISIMILTSCFHTDKSTFVEIKIDKDSMLTLGYPERIVNQYEIVRTTKKFSGKSFFIVDTKENLIFCFDKNGKFVAKSPTIDGFDKQSNNPTKINETLQRWTKHAADAGFKWNKITKKYIDTTGRNRIYSTSVVYNFLGQKKRRFFPKGTYIIKSTQSTKSFLGSSVNTYNIQTLDGEPLALAIHSLYKSQFRINSMNTLKKLVGSNFNEMSVSKNYRSVVSQNMDNGLFNNSFGCINVPLEFISLTKNKAINSYIFVIGENEKDYTI